MAKRRRRMPPKALVARRIKVVDMAIGGATIRQIAEHFQIGKSTAHDDLQWGLGFLREATIDTAAEHRNLQSLRIDALIRAHWLPATNRDRVTGKPLPPDSGVDTIAAATLVSRLMHRQSRIHGSDLPDELRARRTMHYLAAHGATGDKLNLSVDQVRELIAQEEAAAAAESAGVDPADDDPPPAEPDDDAAAHH